MSGIVQIVGQASGVSSLLSVDASGRAVVRDADSIAKTTLIAASTAAMVVDLAAIEVLTTGGNASLSACATDLAAIEVLQTGGNASLSACATDLAAIEVLQTGGNASLSACATDLAAIEVKQNAIASALAGTLTVSAPTVATVNVLLEDATSVGVDATETSPSTDMNNAKRVAVFGSITDSGANIIVEVSADNSTFYVNTEQTIYIQSTNFFKTITLDARYIRFKYSNSSGSVVDWTLNMSKKV